MRKVEMLAYISKHRGKVYCFRKKIEKNGKIHVQCKYLTDKEFNLYKHKYLHYCLINGRKISFNKYLDFILFEGKIWR